MRAGRRSMHPCRCSSANLTSLRRTSACRTTSATPESGSARLRAQDRGQCTSYPDDPETSAQSRSTSFLPRSSYPDGAGPAHQRIFVHPDFLWMDHFDIVCPAAVVFLALPPVDPGRACLVRIDFLQRSANLGAGFELLRRGLVNQHIAVQRGLVAVSRQSPGLRPVAETAS